MSSIFFIKNCVSLFFGILRVEFLKIRRQFLMKMSALLKIVIFQIISIFVVGLLYLKYDIL